MMRGTVAIAAAVVLSAACKNKEQTKPQPAPTPVGSGSAVAAPVPVPPPAPDASPAPAAADLTPKIDAVMPNIRKLAAEGDVVKAVKAQNAKKMSLDAIKNFDAEWSAATGVTDRMKPYLDNPCAKALDAGKAQTPALVEAFAMDDQGGLVCSISKTSDYWQGDEPKWQQSFASGKGAEFVDKPKFDDSSQTYSVQVSVPVMDGGKVIGAITVGLGLEKL